MDRQTGSTGGSAQGFRAGLGWFRGAIKDSILKG